MVRRRRLTPSGRRTVVSLCVAFVALGLYIATMAPGLTWSFDSADGGDLAVAAHSLGIAHPPGYPTYVLLAHPWTRLPFGEVATRTNLFSAVCAAGAAATLTWAVARSFDDWIAAAVAGLACSCAPMLWSQAIVTEVHALQTLFCALLLAAAVISEDRPGGGQPAGPAIAAGAGLVWGLSLGNGPTALFYAPLVFVTVRRRQGIVPALGGFVAGLSVYMVLPLRAVAGPAANWGDPRTFGRFWWVVSGALYRGYIFAYPTPAVPSRLLSTMSLLARQFGLPGLALAGAGVAARWPGRRRVLVSAAVTSLAIAAFSVGYDTADSYLYLAPILVFLAYCLGSGTAWALARIGANTPALRFGLGLGAVVVLAVSIVRRAPEMNLREDRAPEVIRDRVLGAAPDHALILSQRDSHTFALWYYVHALGERPDVAVVDVGLLGLDWYNQRVADEIGNGTSIRSIGGGSREDLAAASEAVGRPVCMIYGEDDARLTCTED